MEFRELGRTGLAVSRLGFGAAPLGNEFGEMDEADGARAVHAALDGGINFFDTAPYYGRGLSETRLGAALEGRRQEVILATKCARFDKDRFDFSAASATESIEISLRRLRTDYVDILHVHDIEFGDRRQIVEETIPALRRIQESGKARFIGITGLSVRMLRETASEAPVDCMLSYCRYNLLNQDLEAELAPFAAENHVGLINASPLHMGILSAAGPPSWHPASEPVKAAGREILSLCRQRNVDIFSISLQFAVGNPVIATTLSGMMTEEQVNANVAAIRETPSPELLAQIAAIARPVQHLMWITGRPENH